MKKEEPQIKNGKWQGCILSSMLFNLYIEEILKELRMEVKQGVRIGEETNTLRFADEIDFY